ncbi:glycosyl hydrolase 115 family protein [Novosphingobium terrae]|uniref:glycosyl hydrolase 115 family protein n=1 Tax=Novosphingobium terrae TaxID=2726189 RepID=UPI0019815703|nr:glycosyl hydrolase 115 family protein [Novosphingobium terrae]
MRPFYRLSRRQLLSGVASTSALLPVVPALAWGAGSGKAADFPLIAAGVPATIVVEDSANSAVRYAAQCLASDIKRSCSTSPPWRADPRQAGGPILMVGVLGQSPALDALVAARRIDVSRLKGQWESHLRLVVERPYPGVSEALVIIGSDRRGAAFALYDLCQHVGVSPWHWFADVPVPFRQNVFVSRHPHLDGPKVRYRGFFINDEDPCFSGWAKKAFGGINSAMYVHVFELLLRMKGNYLWPAMWAPKAFAADDPQNMVIADRMGVVMGNSHHEPMLRAQSEWHRNQELGVTGGPWDYARNADNLRRFWRGGIERMVSKGHGEAYESLVTVGMRGDGDEAMAEGTATDLLERIVTDQRRIIAEVTGKPASEMPQLWALYKEVQDYYDHGMKVPDDVTLLFSDDNWGQIRRLPKPGAPPRSGGYGIYYHFDYVGVPRNYKWINTNQIEKTWQQMDLAYQRGARQIWIANVGDIKPMEFPLGFFLAMAWNPEAMTPQALQAYPRDWAEATFGRDHADAIARIITAYSQFAARRKPELIDQDSFPIGKATAEALDGGEFGQIVDAWDELEARMLAVRDRLRPDQMDAYYQLVEFPVSAMANLYRLYYATAWNRALATTNDPRANYFANEVETAFARDRALTERYHTIHGGKWDGMMNQVHMNYVTWNDPTQQTMPSIMRVGADTPDDQRHTKPAFVTPALRQPGIVARDAGSFDRAHHGPNLRWTVIPHLGRTAGAVLALPQGQGATTGKDGVRLDYDMIVDTPGPASLTLFTTPTLDTLGEGGVRIGVSVDDRPMQILTADLEATGGGQKTPGQKRWAQAVEDNIVRLTADLGPMAAGKHVVTLWRLDDNVAVQKLVLSTVPLPPSYLGPDTA